MCARYPGTRPSEFFPELDTTDALILDVTLAYKYHYREYDLTNERLHQLIDTMSMGFTAMAGQKPEPSESPQRLTRDDNYNEDDEDELPSTAALMAQANTGTGIVIIE